MLAEFQASRGELLVHVEAQLGQAGRLGLHALGGDALQGGPAPHGEGLLEAGAGLLQVPPAGGGLSFGGPLLELDGVDTVFAGEEHVAGVAGDEDAVDAERGLEGLAQRGDADGDLVAGSGGWFAVPDGVGERVDGDDPPGRQQQHRHDGALAAALQGHGPSLGADVQRPQDPEHHLKHRCLPTPAAAVPVRPVSPLSD